MNISTLLKYPKKVKSSIFFRFRYKNTYIKVYTGLSIRVNKWSIAKQKVKGDDDESIKLNNDLITWKSIISKTLTENDIPLDEVQSTCKRIIAGQDIFRPYIEVVTDESPDGLYKSTEKIEDYNYVSKKINSNIRLKDVINKYIEDKSDILAPGRIRHFRSVINRLKDANGLDIVKIDEFSIDHFTIFRKHLFNEGKTNETVNSKIKLVKTAIKEFNPQHPALVFKNVELKGKLKHVMITSNELDQIRKSRKLKDFEKIRDIFIFSCLTGQRISDIIKITDLQIINKWWHLRQQKTKADTKIPLDAEALKILNKYGNKMPHMTEQHYNRELKKMFKVAGFEKPVELPRDSGSADATKKGKFYEFVSSHLGRRYFITTEISKGTPINIIASITRQSIKTLDKYVQTLDLHVQEYYEKRREEEDKLQN